MPGPAFHLRLTARALRAMGRAGLLAPTRPDRLARIAAAPARLGLGPAAIVAGAAARHPEQPALVDERGSLTYAELDRRAAAVAAGLRRDLGVRPGGALGVMCRNHRGFLEAVLAGSRCGADLLLLNTDFAGPQLSEVVERERPAAVVHDEEFSEPFRQAGYDDRRVVAWHDRDPGAPTLDAMIGRGGGGSAASRKQGTLVMLTSGTTGTPKGAHRKPSLRALIGPMTTLLSQVPVRAREPMLIGPPFFHAFGFAYLALGLFLGSTVVMRRRFDPEAALEAIERHRVTSFIGVPVMHRRVLEAFEQGGRQRDTSSLRALMSGAAPLSPSLAEALMEAFGDVLYNLYGSTETGFGAIAGPADLRAAPGTVGRPPFGTSLEILDDDGRPLGPDETGHVFIGGELVFEGYSGGGEEKETVDDLMNTGDLGHLDPEGRLFIDGRDDDMIVSGGENVFPSEVEDVLSRHDGVADVAVVGVEDEEFGQRLKAYVVAANGVELSEEELRGYVKENLARYKVPREVAFVDEVPRNPTGKVLKAELRERAT